MKKDLTEIVAILDKSGSMQSVRNDALGGINSFIEEQKKVPGEALFTLVLFDAYIHVKYSGIDIKKIDVLKEREYTPGGSTALLDAIGKTIDDVGERLANTPESQRPEKVIVAILTDGEENASCILSDAEDAKGNKVRKYTKETINKRISLQRDVYKWEFIFLAANQDAIQAGNELGILNSAGYVSDSVGTGLAYRALSKVVGGYRSTGKIDKDRLKS